MRKAAPTAAALLVGGLILTLLIALPLGALSALRPRSLVDKGGMVIALFGMSLHPVSIGLGLAYLLGHRAGAFPVQGYCDLLSPRTSCGGPGSGSTTWCCHR